MDPQEIQQSIQAVIDGIAPLAQKLQVPLEKVFEYAVRQNYVYAYWQLISDFALLIIGITCFLIAKSTIKKADWKDDGNSYAWFTILSSVTCLFASIFFIIVFFTSGSEIIARFLNPEYMALQDIAKLIFNK
jgi:hypothetical protein